MGLPPEAHPPLPPSGADVADPDAQLVLTHDRAWQTEDIVAWQCARAGVDLDTLKDHPHGLLVETERPVVSAPAQDDGARLDLCPPDVAAELSASFSRRRDQPSWSRCVHTARPTPGGKGSSVNNVVVD